MANDDELRDHDRGLSFDLSTLMSRRRALTLLGGASLAVAGCSSGSGGSASNGPTTKSVTTTAPASTAPPTAAITAAHVPPNTRIPYEIAGPSAIDGSTGPNVLTESGILRRDIRSSFGGPTSVAKGVPATVDFTVLDVANGDRPYQGAAVYLWQCDRDGLYSLYDQPIHQQNYLRGVQVADGDGRVSFTSIFAGAYATRWPHLHLEVYKDIATATTGGNIVKTTQIALPEAACQAVYATPGYEQSARLLPQTPLSQDLAFKDGYALQMTTATGDVKSGYTISLALPV